MKKAAILLFLVLPLTMMAQVWELPEQQGQKQTTESKTKVKTSDANKDARYLAGAVPEIDGEVAWERTYNTACDAVTNYNKMLDYFTAFTKQDNQLPESHVALLDKNEHKIAIAINEWLLFRSNFINLDRTEFDYTVLVECFGSKVHVKIYRLRYVYEEHRDGGLRYTAEELISDRYALNKSKTKLVKKMSKFRRKTVDRMEEVLSDIDNYLKK